MKRQARLGGRVEALPESWNLIKALQDGKNVVLYYGFHFGIVAFLDYESDIQDVDD